MPIYIVVVTGLLFAALAFVVVGMAGATRSEAQAAADAAALAAAREVRDNAFLGTDFLALKQGDWEAILEGDRLGVQGACGKALAFAALNDATATCQANIRVFTVTATTNGTVGKSVIPGSESVKGHATAKAVIEPRCSLQPDATPTPSPTPSPGGGDPGPPASLDFRCKGGAVVTLDPAKPGSLIQLARKLFSVRLTD
ncbi:pilus assembly protein TadG-related protein [Streptomyces sp. ISL-94]|uniref:pilus assembly protein TadG-related protein n=1 Tax=Streptomyces sp. ISL-94 TaxID=2819190 RepID=UPI0020357D94|nr:pilus assembly protein TadG-related protein [Streptomyces sp. ISL-94]